MIRLVKFKKSGGKCAPQLKSQWKLTNLDPLALKTIVQAATPHKIERGGFLFHQGEPSTSFFVLIEGRTRLSQIADDGRQVIFHYSGLAMLWVSLSPWLIRDTPFLQKR